MNNPSSDSAQIEAPATKDEQPLSAAGESLPESEAVEIAAPQSEKLPGRFWSRIKPRFRSQTRRDARLIGMMLAIKALCMIFAVQSFHVWVDQPVNGWRGWLEIWNRWDALNYLKLAEHGYNAMGEMRPTMVFYPLYPWLISLLN
ncbi:MAG: hypothetical protein ACRD82_14985, partial [Blastocatellia bacterium]